MISITRGFSSDAAWHFAFSNFWRILREQQYILIAILVVDLVLTFFTGGHIRIAGYLAIFPLYASAIRLVKPRFEMTGTFLFRLILVQVCVAILAGAIPLLFYFMGTLLGGAPMWFIIGAVLSIPLGAKLALSAPLALLDHGTGQPIVDAITGSWNAMNTQELFDYVILLIKMALFVTLIVIVPIIVLGMILSAVGLISLFPVLLDPFQMAAAALSCAMTVSAVAQLFPELVPAEET